ncbi:TRAP transporter substrate-binding protein [Sneathiella chinensis]|uniref:C4-dicarboxylate ABC transporter substrate-binding protein n=1 Tax=Sneathiella chinensis TaxID=349750 RepID=A0ABQ5U791_9PROT|nr:TRAP transporter substrate-binding protein DctP [Sneathiella chinensis]GLQ07134.1 hypothetical protein GCM10007924_23550 [Sneathiella chinensis]
MNWKAVLCGAAVAVALGSGTSAAVAETKLKYATSAPVKTPWVAHANQVAAAVQEATGGSVKIDVFPGSQLGNEQDVIRQVARGRVQMGAFSNTAASLIVPEISLLAAPYIWDNVAQADCALDNHMDAVFQDRFKEMDLVFLGWTEVGQMGYASAKPIESLTELSGKKVRVAPSKTSSLTAESVGANSVMLPITEVASALQTGLVDSADLPGLAFTSLGIGKIAPHWIATNHSHQVGVVLMSRKVWSKLTPEEQTQMQAARVDPTILRKQVRGAEKMMFGKFEEAGGRIVHPEGEELDRWKQAGEQARLALVKELGDKGAAVYEQIQQAKRACSS